LKLTFEFQLEHHVFPVTARLFSVQIPLAAGLELLPLSGDILANMICKRQRQGHEDATDQEWPPTDNDEDSDIEVLEEAPPIFQGRGLMNPRKGLTALFRRHMTISPPDDEIGQEITRKFFSRLTTQSSLPDTQSSYPQKVVAIKQHRQVTGTYGAMQGNVARNKNLYQDIVYLCGSYTLRVVHLLNVAQPVG